MAIPLPQLRMRVHSSKTRKERQHNLAVESNGPAVLEKRYAAVLFSKDSITTWDFSQECVESGDYTDLLVTLERSAEHGIGLVLDHLGDPPHHRIWVDELIPDAPADQVRGHCPLPPRLLTDHFVCRAARLKLAIH